MMTEQKQPESPWIAIFAILIVLVFNSCKDLIHRNEAQRNYDFMIEWIKGEQKLNEIALEMYKVSSRRITFIKYRVDAIEKGAHQWTRRN